MGIRITVQRSRDIMDGEIVAWSHAAVVLVAVAVMHWVGFDFWPSLGLIAAWRTVMLVVSIAGYVYSGD